MLSEGIIDHTGTQTMLNLTCTTITSVDLAHYGVSRAEDWVSVDCGTITDYWNVQIKDKELAAVLKENFLRTVKAYKERIYDSRSHLDINLLCFY